MSVFQPFNPSYGSGQNVTAAGTSASVSLSNKTKQVRIVNTGATNAAQVRLGSGSATATAADFHIQPNSIEVITKNTDHDVLAYISAAGTTLNIMEGEGW